MLGDPNMSVTQAPGSTGDDIAEAFAEASTPFERRPLPILRARGGGSKSGSPPAS